MFSYCHIDTRAAAQSLQPQNRRDGRLACCDHVLKQSGDIDLDPRAIGVEFGHMTGIPAFNCPHLVALMSRKSVRAQEIFQLGNAQKLDLGTIRGQLYQ
ncbi:hypothetical protein FA04_33970 (plasmid) [Ensifer adhaerens]|jgi:hypothetical protein|nr:hypothetical protein FA04_33970 [Ensifer adhaerens]KDP72537.1 hypothetical protein FA04_17045 [Ensifer adhaerens]OKP71370.1 hypothetical protein BTE77_25590 [Ensifer adhaerens]